MTGPTLSSETLHASTVAKDGRAVLIAGRSGAGKSDLALRMIDRGWSLVSDDYTMVRRANGRLHAAAPANIKGRIEVRGVGILAVDFVEEALICLAVDLDRDTVRLPEMNEPLTIAGVRVPVIGLNGLEASAPVKVERALDHFGLRTE